MLLAGEAGAQQQLLQSPRAPLEDGDGMQGARHGDRWEIGEASAPPGFGGEAGKGLALAGISRGPGQDALPSTRGPALAAAGALRDSAGSTVPSPVPAVWGVLSGQPPSPPSAGLLSSSPLCREAAQRAEEVTDGAERFAKAQVGLVGLGAVIPAEVSSFS